MKIQKSAAHTINVTIQRNKQGSVILRSETETGIQDRTELEEAITENRFSGISGLVVLATKYEVELLKEANASQISIKEDFMPTDVYSEMDSTAKNRFWMDHDDSVTIDDANNAHYIDGNGPIDYAIILEKYNQN